MKTMRTIFMAVLLLGTSIFSEEITKKDKIQNAVTSMKSWLEIVDTESYSESWELTGKIFMDQLSDEQWSEALNKSRKPLGSMIERKLKTSKLKKELPGVPDGEYVVAQFKTKFKKKKKAIETVTASFEDEKWKVVGYYIK